MIWSIAAAGLAPHLLQGAAVGVLGFAADFFAANEHEIAFVGWLQANRADVRVHVARFGRMDEAAKLGEQMVVTHPNLAGLFTVSDTPALAVPDRLGHLGRAWPTAKVDPGKDVAIDPG